jgi:SAM-dependent methyltransferase
MGAENDQTSFRCRLCGGGNLTAHALQRGDERLRYFRCRKCGLFNRDIANGVAVEPIDDFAVDPAEDTAPENMARDRTYRFLERHLSPPGRLLDFGCGNGRLMYTARRGGWDVKGVERTPERAQRIRERLGTAVVVADMATLDPDAVDAVKFDVVCVHFGLEQVADPVTALTRLRALLTESGHIVADVTNARSLSASLALSRAKRSLRREPSYDAARSANLFARASFQLLLRRTGFDLMTWETYSDAPLADFLCRYVSIGRYARALIRKRRR